jgi:hypothetical protein
MLFQRILATVHNMQAEHDEHVIQMNEVRRCASGWVQRAACKVATMIEEPGHPTGHLSIPFERGDDHVEDNFRCVARSFRLCRTRHGGWFR